MNGWLIVWSQPIVTARSARAWSRTSGGTNLGRGTRAIASRTRGSRIPFCRNCRRSAAAGAGSGGGGMGLVLGLEVLDHELDLAPAVVVVDLRLADDRDGRPLGKLPPPVGL